MSALARTALRLAAIEAFRADPVIAALCGERIYDSRLAPFDAGEPVPVLVVLTEEMEGEPYDDAGGGPPFDDRVQLIVEIAVRAVIQDSDEAAQIGVAETDSEMEAVLDLIEHRALEALTVADTAASRLVRSAVLRRVDKQKSQRFVEDETGAKLAIRQPAFSCCLKGEDQGSAVAPPAAGEFAALPDPLRSICAGLPEGSSGRRTCRLLAGAMADPAASSLFTGADMVFAPQQLSAAASPPPPDQPGSNPTLGLDQTIP